MSSEFPVKSAEGKDLFVDFSLGGGAEKICEHPAAEIQTQERVTITSIHFPLQLSLGTQPMECVCVCVSTCKDIYCVCGPGITHFVETCLPYGDKKQVPIM